MFFGSGILVVVGTIAPAMIGAAAIPILVRLFLAKSIAAVGLAIALLKPAETAPEGVMRVTASFVNCSATCAGMASPNAKFAPLNCCCAVVAALAALIPPPAVIKLSPRPAPP